MEDRSISDGGSFSACCLGQCRLDGPLASEADVESICLTEIVNVRVEPRNTQKKTATQHGGPRNPRSHVVKVHHVTSLARKRLRLGLRTFFGSEAQCQDLANNINNLRSPGSTCQTGRNLLVFVNPFAGKGRCLYLYRTCVEPVFRACDVNARVKVTSRPEEMHQKIKTFDLTNVDGVIVVGGDGTYNIAMNALLERAITEVGCDVNSRFSDFVPASVPLGILPGGSGNYLARQLNGTTDITTAAINIVRGGTLWTDVLSLHEPERLVSLCGLTLQFGFCGDIIRQAELARWMGPVRYKVASSYKLLQRRTASVELHLLPPDNPVSSMASSRSCRCSVDPDSFPFGYPRTTPRVRPSEDTESPSPSSSLTRDSHTPPAAESQVKFSRTQGPDVDDAMDVDVADLPSSSDDHENSRSRTNTSFNWDEKPRTESCEVHNIGLYITRPLRPDGSMGVGFGLGAALAHVTKKCRMRELLAHMVKVRDNEPGQTDFDFVDCQYMKEMTVRLADACTREQTWYLNCDGISIALMSDRFYVRLHSRVLRLFGRVEQPSHVGR